jgi:hypothetical protein
MRYCHHFAYVVISKLLLLIFFSETTGPIKTKIGRNVHWMFFCKEYVFLYHDQKSTTIWSFGSLVLRDPKVEKGHIIIG